MSEFEKTATRFICYNLQARAQEKYLTLNDTSLLANLECVGWITLR